MFHLDKMLCFVVVGVFLNGKMRFHQEVVALLWMLSYNFYCFSGHKVMFTAAFFIYVLATVGPRQIADLGGDLDPCVKRFFFLHVCIQAVGCDS